MILHRTLCTALGAIALLSSACSASARFYSKNGGSYPELTEHAVVCSESEIAAVSNAGGTPIGTISAKGLTITSSQEDVAEKAAKVAAKSGGTHILLTEKGIDAFTVTNPATKEKHCSQAQGSVDCTTIYSPPSTTTYEKPTAKFVVFRVSPETWNQLPAPLRPFPTN